MPKNYGVKKRTKKNRKTTIKTQKPKAKKPLKPSKRKPGTPKGLASKLFGLNVLAVLSKGTGVKILPWKIYKGTEFSLSDFKNPRTGRIIVRTDTVRTDQRSSQWLWRTAPRRNFDINYEQPKLTEQAIIKWMQTIKESHTNKLKYHRRVDETEINIPSDIVFITHKVPAITEYDSIIQINVTSTGTIRISRKKPDSGQSFRGKSKPVSLKIDEVNQNTLSLMLGSKPLAEKIFPFLEKIIRYAQRLNETRFEANAVVYEKDPNTPEFYDLIFGKKIGW